jgi:uncharacterized coiled-coil protein SlyX
MKEVTLSLAITISKLESDKLVLNKRIAELEETVSKHIEICERHVSTRKYLEKRIAELEKTEPLLQKVLDCCDGLHCEYTQANYGDAKNWLRHISDAYADYQDSIDLSKGGAE